MDDQHRRRGAVFIGCGHIDIDSSLFAHGLFFGLKGGIVTSEDFAVGQKHRELEGLALGIASVREIWIELVLGANLVIAVAV